MAYKSHGLTQQADNPEIQTIENNIEAAMASMDIVGFDRLYPIATGNSETQGSAGMHMPETEYEVHKSQVSMEA